jgi:hypothetical protein
MSELMQKRYSRATLSALVMSGLTALTWLLMIVMVIAAVD